MVQEGCPLSALRCRSKVCSSIRRPRRHSSLEPCGWIASGSFVQSAQFATTEEPRGAKVARLFLTSLFRDNEIPGSNRYLLTTRQWFASQEIVSDAIGIANRRRRAGVVQDVVHLVPVLADAVFHANARWKLLVRTRQACCF